MLVTAMTDSFSLVMEEGGVPYNTLLIIIYY